MTSKDASTAKPIAFPSKAKLLQVLGAEIEMLVSAKDKAVKLRGAEQPGTAEFVWFDAWVLRLEDLIEQAQKWATVIRSGSAPEKAAIREELVAERKILSGLIGLMNIAIMTGIEDEETDDLIRYYKKDFRKTQGNIKNLLKTRVWS